MGPVMCTGCVIYHVLTGYASGHNDRRISATLVVSYDLRNRSQRDSTWKPEMQPLALYEHRLRWLLMREGTIQFEGKPYDPDKFDEYCQQMIDGTPTGIQFARLLLSRYHKYIMEEPRVVKARENNWREEGQDSPIPTVNVWPQDETRGNRIKKIIRSTPVSRGRFVEYSDECMPALSEREVPKPENTTWMVQSFSANSPRQGAAAAASSAAASSSSSGLRRGEPPPPPLVTSPGTGSGSDRPLPPPPPTRPQTLDPTEEDGFPVDVRRAGTFAQSGVGAPPPPPFREPNIAEDNTTGQAGWAGGDPTQYELEHGFQRQDEHKPLYLATARCTPVSELDASLPWLSRKCCAQWECDRLVDPDPWRNREYCAAAGYCCKRCYYLDYKQKPQSTTRRVWGHSDECECRYKTQGPASPRAIQDKEEAYYVQQKVAYIQKKPHSKPTPQPFCPSPDYLMAGCGPDGEGTTVTVEKDQIPITKDMLRPDYKFPNTELAHHIYNHLDRERWVVPGGRDKEREEETRHRSYR